MTRPESSPGAREGATSATREAGGGSRRAEAWPAADGALLHVAHAAPDGAARGHVVVVHGYSEHGGRYVELMDALVSAGLAVHALDLRGHGHSAGPRGFIDDADLLVEDVTRLLEQMQAEPGPLALFGHSFGGALALRTAQERPDLLDALVASAPYLRTALDDPPWMFRLSAILSHVFPRLRTRPLNAGSVSSLPDEVRAYREDPLVDRRGVPLASVRELHALGPTVLAEAARLVTPTLIVHGSADPLADVEGSRQLARAAGGGDLTLRVVDDGYHDLLHDRDRDRVRVGIVDWLLDRLGLRESTVELPIDG